MIHIPNTYGQNKENASHQTEKKRQILERNKDLDNIVHIIKEAGKNILKYYKGNNLGTKYKMDEFDPVTQADLQSEKYINQSIREYFPNDKILSEETENDLLDFS